MSEPEMRFSLILVIPGFNIFLADLEEHEMMALEDEFVASRMNPKTMVIGTWGPTNAHYLWAWADVKVIHRAGQAVKP
jgi:hypothetical protein